MTIRWTIPSHVMEDTRRAFLRGRHEVFAVWTAPLVVPNDAIEVRRCVIPEQTPGMTPSGVYVHIAGSELARIAFENFSHQQRSVIQLHTHPGYDVSMSNLDREWEVVRHMGALSIIVPHYGVQGLVGFPGVNVYERERDDWRLWTRDEVAARLQVLP